MRDSTDDISAGIVDGLSVLIMRELSVVSNEEHYPQGDPDKMDSIISTGKNKAAALRKLREDFENIKSGIL